jgi:hypothetical protein
MSLPTTLNTNEVKNSAGTEQEFGRLSQSDRQLVFNLLTEAPYTPHRITCSHTETGSATKRRRRSVVRVDKSIAGQVDTTVTEKISCYTVIDAPVGNMTTTTELANVVANLNSFMASLGASTTILYDGTGSGSAVLINGTL